MRPIVLAGLFALIAFAVLWWPKADPVGVVPATTTRPLPPPEPPPRPARHFTATEENSRLVQRTPQGSYILPDIAETARQLHSRETTADHDLEILQSLLAFFRTSNGGANPDGGLNVEIVAALRGKNPNHFAVLPPDLPVFNAEGELLDRWGTPYWFHPISRTVVEIRTAGPDKKLWSPDDIEIETAPPETVRGLTGN